ncbi:MAG: hypothetical protein ACYTFA_18700 [Planctomycetota bacterium]|jgi:hypothetical protein
MPTIVKPRHLAYAAVCIVLTGASGTLIFDKGTETPTQRAYKECRPCGLAESEIDELIDTRRHSTVSREESIELFESTFSPDETGPEDCTPCLEAVLDAAGVP